MRGAPDRLQFQGAGALPWLLGRSNGPAGSIYNRLAADNRFSSNQILSEVQRYLETLLSPNGHSAYQLVFGSNPAGHFGSGADDEDLLLAPETPLSGQFAQQWKLRIIAQDAAPKEVASSKLCRLLPYNRSFNCTDAQSEGSVLLKVFGPGADAKVARPGKDYCRREHRGNGRVSASNFQSGAVLCAAQD